MSTEVEKKIAKTRINKGNKRVRVGGGGGGWGMLQLRYIVPRGQNNPVGDNTTWYLVPGDKINCYTGSKLD